MRWQDCNSTFEKKLKSNPPPNYFVVHLGSNDSDILPGAQLFQSIECSFLRCKLLAPNMSIIWSDMLPCLYWHNFKSAARVDSMRKEVNRKVKQFLKSEGGGASYQTSNTHLNQLGNSVFLMVCRVALKLYYSTQNWNSFSCMALTLGGLQWGVFPPQLPVGALSCQALRKVTPVGR